MKRCPECKRDFYDDTLSFCLEDGTALVYGVIADEPRTAKLQSTATPAEAPTRAQINTANETAILPDITPPTAQTRSRRNSVVAGVFGIILLAGLAVGAYLLYSSGSTRQIESIAVMPFVNDSGNADVEYLSDGMTESLISSLSQLPNLSVKARSSVFRYKGKELELNKIGKELSVQAVLTGTVVRRGQDLALFIELVDTNTERVLWSENYSRPLTDLPALQNDIARDISRKLRTRFSGANEQHLANSQTENSEAYQLYLLGRYHLNRLTDEGFRKGLDYFEQAIAKDQNYALAYAGKASAYNKLGGFNAIPPHEGFPKARAAASKALELDDQLAEAHVVLGFVKYFYDWDWSGAEKEFKRAIEIDPNNADAHHGYGYFLSAMGRFEEALAEMRRAQELDPLSIDKIGAVGEVFYHQRKYDQTVEQLQKALEMDPNSGVMHWGLGNVYVQKGMYNEAIRQYEKSIPLSGDSPDEPASLAYVYAITGKRQEALRIIEDLKQRSKRQYISPTIIAFIYTGLGDNDSAFEWLKRAYKERDFILVLLKAEPMFDRLRDDPRFSELVRQVGLP